MADFGFLVAPAMDLDVDLLGQFAAEIFDVYAGTAVDVGRVFTGKESGSQ
jgi:hypothetical protein